MYSRPRVGPVPRTVSTNTYGISSAPDRDQMDPEVRAQILSNIRVIYEPTVASHIHIATCRGTDNTFMAFLVMHGNLIKTVWDPNLLAGDAKQARAAALLSLLESTEDRIREMLLRDSKSSKKTTKENKQDRKCSSAKGERGRSMPPPSDAGSLSENGSLDYGVRPKEKEKRFLPWRRTSTALKSDSVYTQIG